MGGPLLCVLVLLAAAPGVSAAPAALVPDPHIGEEVWVILDLVVCDTGRLCILPLPPGGGSHAP